MHTVIPLVVKANKNNHTYKVAQTYQHQHDPALTYILSKQPTWTPAYSADTHVSSTTGIGSFSQIE